MKKISLYQALKTCRDGWKEIADKSLDSRPDTFVAYMHYCQCCQFVKDRGIVSGFPEAACVKYCPLYMLWPKGCITDNAPYTLWKEARFENTDEANRAAYTISKAADKAMKNPLTYIIIYSRLMKRRIKTWIRLKE